MGKSIALLLGSRKGSVTFIVVAAILAATVGLATGKLPLAGFVGFITTVTFACSTLVASIAHEDHADKLAVGTVRAAHIAAGALENAPPASTNTTTNGAVTSAPASPSEPTTLAAPVAIPVTVVAPTENSGK